MTMHTEINAIVQHLFGKDDAGQIEDAALETMLSQYPYLSVARYLAAWRKYRQEEDDTPDELITAGLYLNNPMWLQWLLENHPKPEGSDRTTDEAGAEMPPSLPEPASTDTPAPTLTSSPPEAAGSGTVTLSASLALTAEPADTEPIVDKPVDTEPIAAESASTEPAVAESGADETISTEPATAESAAADTGNTPHPAPDDIHDSLPDSPSQTDSERAPVVEASDPPNADSEEPLPIVFQSYHTIDYFASQGIRLQQAELTKDRFGQQLKSFTEWLRSMKKLPHTGDGPSFPEDPGRQQLVLRSAESSLEDREVYTEAMAEVWAKQGNLQKARSIYEKLSLLNPSKSPYFAAKIDQLKAV